LAQISEYWFQQDLFGKRLRIKLGKQDVNVDCCALDYGGDFINSSFGVIPTVPMPTFPDPALGASAFPEPADWMGLSAGMYDGAPNGGSLGFDTAFDGKGGGFGIVELTLRTSLIGKRLKPGAYRIGFWYHSDDVEKIGDGVITSSALGEALSALVGQDDRVTPLIERLGQLYEEAAVACCTVVEDENGCIGPGMWIHIDMKLHACRLNLKLLAGLFAVLDDFSIVVDVPVVGIHGLLSPHGNLAGLGARASSQQATAR
jgi:hypothetical protein